MSKIDNEKNEKQKQALNILEKKVVLLKNILKKFRLFLEKKMRLDERKELALLDKKLL